MRMNDIFMSFAFAHITTACPLPFAIIIAIILKSFSSETAVFCTPDLTRRFIYN